jgi:UDP-N-acetylglucosamine 2-epimerase (non-hydrolysing)
MKICFILGTRPEIIKLYSLIKYCESKKIKCFVIHTNQHYDKNMDEIFFKELGLKKAKYNLGVGSGNQGDQTGRMLIAIEKVLMKEKPDYVFVQGDTNTVLAGSLVASKMKIKVCHVEAGLRSYDREMPEEINRIISDHVSDFLFCPTEKQANIVLKEGINKKKIFVTGNTIVDAVLLVSKMSDEKSKVLNKFNLEKEKYFLLTCHRPSNTDNIDNFKSIISSINDICEKEGFKCIFPMHPRLGSKIGFVKKFKNIITSDPLGYLDLLKLQKDSSMIFTDSGGIQEESCILKKKCLILRTNTERPETVKVGGAVLLKDISKEEIMKKYILLKNKKVEWYNPFGDGKTARKIFKILN